MKNDEIMVDSQGVPNDGQGETCHFGHTHTGRRFEIQLRGDLGEYHLLTGFPLTVVAVLDPSLRADQRQILLAMLNAHDQLVEAVRLAHERLRPTKKISTTEGFGQHVAWAALGKALHSLQLYPGCTNCAAGTCGLKTVGEL